MNSQQHANGAAPPIGTKARSALPQGGFFKLIGGWPAGKKIVLGAAVGAGIAILLMLIQFARYADYQLLYGDLPRSDAAAIGRWLEDQNIGYRLKNGGTDILIPAGLIHRIRLELADSGLPGSTPGGFVFFDRKTQLITDYIQNVDQTSALQRELSRAIGALAPVVSARVILSIPQQNSLANTQVDPSASVFLTLLPGSRLSTEQIQAIIHLISASVRGLPADQITLVDSNGALIEHNPGVSGNRFSGDMLSFQQQIEKRLEKKVQPLLDRVLGANKTLVKISAIVDFSRTEKTLELFDPEEPVVKSEQSSEESAASPSADLAGPPGQRPTGSGDIVKTSSHITYEISKTTSTTIDPVGRIENLSVSIMVDPADSTVDNQASHQSGFDEALAGTLEKMLAGAIGFNPERGDILHLISMPFAGGEPALVEPLRGYLFYEFVPAMKYVLLFAGLLLLYLLLIRPVIKMVRGELSGHHRHVEETPDPGTSGSETRTEEYFAATLQQEVVLDPAPTAYIVKTWLQET